MTCHRYLIHHEENQAGQPGLIFTYMDIKLFQ